MTHFVAHGNDKPTHPDDSHPRTDALRKLSSSEAPIQYVRVAILGAGFSGLGMAIRLRRGSFFLKPTMIFAEIQPMLERLIFQQIGQ